MCEDASDEDCWSIYQKLTRPRCRRGVANLLVDDHLISDDIGKAAALCDRFFPWALPPDDASHVAVASRVSSALGFASDSVVEPITMMELHGAIWSSPPWKAPGTDQIPNVCLRQCEILLNSHLLTVFNASLRLQYFLESWKHAVVIPVPKPEGDLSIPKGYRPISLLSCLSKTLERVITDRITSFLEDTCALSDFQYGFRRGRSSTLAIWRFVSAASLALQSRRKTVVIALDIQGAYDRVWLTGLLAKMLDLHFPIALLRWISSFLSDRDVELHVGEASESRRLCMGVPQGSPLSPVLFLIFIDDLLPSLSPLVSVQAYADDILIWWHTDKGCTGEALGQQALAIVEQWSSRWKVTFDTGKCHPMVVSRLRQEPLPSFSFGGTSLELVDRLRYLGVWIDPRLTWNAHIQMVTQTALDRLRLIHRGAGTLWGLHPMVFSKMIRAAVLPVLFYAAPAWCPVVGFKTRLQRLDRVLRLCALSILGLLRTTSGDAARFLAGLLPADLQIRQRVVAFYFRQLEYDRDLLALDSIGERYNRALSPCDILRQELDDLQLSGQSSPSVLKYQIRMEYAHRAAIRWTSSSCGHDLRSVQRQFSSDLSWTEPLTRKEAALTAQFLTGHYPSQSYLRRFGHPVDGSCLWCGAAVDDREHRLFDCPRYEFHRQRLSLEISSDSRGLWSWTWDYLVSMGRRYLGRFLSLVPRCSY